MFNGDKHSSIKLFGPFYYNELTGKVSPNKLSTNPNNTTEKEIYIDFNCFAQNNDFVSTTKRENIFNPTTSIEEVIRQRKTCFRCGSSFATKKCYACQKMFHANLCLSQMTIDYNDHKYCLECFKKKYSKHLQEKIKQKRLNFNKIKKEYFLGKKIYNSQYYPQKGEEVYFILQAYIQFLRDEYQYIIYEINEEKQRLFWWAENTYIEKNPRFDFYEPFLCKVKNIEFIFPNNQTIALIKENISSNQDNQLNSELKILIKLQLQIIELKNSEITIIIFENDNPDFLVRKKIYEETLNYYNENIANKDSFINLKFNLSEDIVTANLTENQPEENNENFSKSKFNSLKVVTDKEKDEQKYSFWDLCINDNDVGLINDKMKFIMSGLKDTINSIYEKNKSEVEIFWDMVPEDNDFDYYNEIPVPMFLKLILERLENNYYINEESLKFDINLLVNNAKKFNQEEAQISIEAEIITNRLLQRVEQLSKKYEANNQVISNGTNIKINLLSDSGGSGNESTKKMTGKKRKRILENIDFDENMFKESDESEDYLFGNSKKRETRSSRSNMKNDISVDIQISNENNIKKNKRKKVI